MSFAHQEARRCPSCCARRVRYPKGCEPPQGAVTGLGWRNSAAAISFRPHLRLVASGVFRRNAEGASI